jgi:hypothetical protein
MVRKRRKRKHALPQSRLTSTQGTLDCVITFNWQVLGTKILMHHAFCMRCRCKYTGGSPGPAATAVRQGGC